MIFFEPYPIVAMPLFLVGIANLTLAAIVLINGKRSHTSILFSLLSFWMSLWCIFVGTTTLGLSSLLIISFAKAAFYIGIPIFYLILLFSFSFPSFKITLPRKYVFLLAIPPLALLFLTPTNLILEANYQAGGVLLKFGPVNIFYTLYCLVYFLFSVIALYSRYYSSTRIDQIRYKYFVMGFLTTITIGVLSNVILVSVIGINRFYYLGPLASIFMIGFTAYAILKYRLMDIALVIKKTTAYSLITTAITFVYVLVVIGFEFLSRLLFGYYSFWSVIPATLIIAVTFVPVRDRVQKVTDQIFFRQMVEYQKVIKEITRMIVSVTDLHTLFRLIDRTIIRVMCIKNASILLLEEKEDQYVVKKTNGLPNVISGIRLSLNDPLVTYLEEKKDAVVLDEVKDTLQSHLTPPEEKKRLTQIQMEMEHFEAALSIPSFLKGKLVGIFNLGEKLSGELYSPDDIELLLTMASEAAIAIENAKLYRDITETRDYLNSLVQGSDDAIFTVDLSGVILSWNEGAKTIFNYTSAEVIGKIPPFFIESEIRQLINKVFRAEKVKAIEMLKRNKSGKEIPLLLTLSSIRDSAANIIGISGILKDITELKKVDQLKSKFLSVVSHELRTPLTPIKGYLSLLLDGKLGEIDPKQREALTIILNQSNHLQNLIDCVLDISRIESGKPLEIQKEPTFLDAIIKESIEALATAFSDKLMKIKVNYPSKPIALMADKKKLLRVMDNLLGNALKFSPSKGSAEVTIKAEDKRIKVAVADTGIGIAPQHREKIFDKFYQIDSSYNRSSGGIGMGLTVAKEIVEAHQGRIWAESKGLGAGSKFIFTLPIS